MDGYGVGGTNRCIARDKGSIGMAFFDVHVRLDWLRSFHPRSLAIASFSWALHLKRLPHVVFMIFFDSQLSFLDAHILCSCHLFHLLYTS